MTAQADEDLLEQAIQQAQAADVDDEVPGTATATGGVRVFFVKEHIEKYRKNGDLTKKNGDLDRL